MASPQTENGYTKIANELLDAMCRLYLSGNQWKVLHAVIRKTYGWNKTVDWITATQIADMTGIHAPHVSTALHELRRRNIILREKRLVAVQKDYDQWQMKAVCNSPKVTRTSNLQEPVTLQEPVIKVTRTSTKSVQEPVRTKDKRNYTKDIGTPAQIYKRVTEKRPRRAHADTMNDKVTDNDLWFSCVYEWIMRGYNQYNVKGMLEWYEKGGPPGAGPQGLSEREAKAAAEEATARDQRKVAEWEAKN